MTMSRNLLAKFLSLVPADARGELFREYHVDQTLDKGWRGMGNSAYRRATGEDVHHGCGGCTTCVVYGGDCASSMWHEDRIEAHRKNRGVKTRGGRFEN